MGFTGIFVPSRIAPDTEKRAAETLDMMGLSVSAATYSR